MHVSHDELVVTITPGRMKDVESPAAFSMQARVVDTGDADDEGRPITTLILEATDAVIKTQPKRPTGKAQKAILSALEARQRDAKAVQVWTLDELRTIAKTHLEIGRTTARDAIAGLIQTSFLKQTIGGISLGYEP